MNLRHFLLALAIALVWGANFSAMKIGLQGISPLVFSGLRSIFILPLLFFIPKPNVSWKFIFLMGTIIGTIKLPLMLLAIHLGVAAGLSSILIQVQAFFTVLLALFFFKQKPTFFNWIGMAISFAGIGLIALQVGGEASFLGLLIILISALFWAASNLIIQKQGKNVDMLGLTAWMNLVPPIPLFILSFFIYGEENFITSFANLNWNSLWSLLYASLGAGLFGYTGWGILLKKYPAAVVAPFSLLVPVFAIGFAYLSLNEGLTPTSIYGCLLVILGLLLNQVRMDLSKPKIFGFFSSKP